MPRLNFYIPMKTGKDHFIKQLDELRELLFDEFGIELSNSRIIILAVEELLREKNKQISKN